MGNYVLEETKNSPAINFDFSKGLLEIGKNLTSGQFYPAI